MERREFKQIKNCDFNVSIITTIVAIASRYKADIYFCANNEKADAKSLINLMALNLSDYNEFEIHFEGSDGYKAIDEITLFLKESKIIE